MCQRSTWVRFQRREVADRVAAVLALLPHDHAQAKADRACFLRVPGRGQSRAYPFQVVIGEPVDDAAHHRHAGAAYFQHLRQRRPRAEVDAERCGVRGREAGLREAEWVIRHRLARTAAYPMTPDQGKRCSARRVSAFPAVAAFRSRRGCCRLRASAGMQGAAND
jgi:hypothetical protein